MSLYHIPAARTDEQRANMEDLEARGICIFCPEYITEDVSPITIETDHWMVKNNSFPYKNTKIHLLLIPKAHARTMPELSDAAQLDFFTALKHAETQYELDSYALVTRSGDMKKNAGSIEHIHTHIIVGDTENPDHEPVRVKVSRKD